MKNPFACALALLLAGAGLLDAFSQVAGDEAGGSPVEMRIADHQRAESPFDATGSFSALLMFKAEIGLHSGSAPRLLMSAGNGFYNGFRLTVIPDDITGAYHPQLEIGQKGGSWSISGPASSISAGRWHRLAATWDGRKVVLYVDGKKAVSGFCTMKYVPAADKRVRVGVPGENYGIGSLPFLVEKAAACTRAMSEREVALWAADAKPFEGDTPLLPSALAKCWNGEPVPTAELEAFGRASFHTPLALLAIDRAKAFSLVADGRYAESERIAKDVVSRLSAMRSGPGLVREFMSRLREVKMSSGALETLLEDYRREYAKARAENSGLLPYAALTFMKALSDTGRAQEAEAVRREMRSCDFKRCPHLAGRFGLAGGEPTAPRQKGASVSRAMPKAAFYVAPCGDDSADGSKLRPFRTLERARAEVRKLKRAGLPKGGVAVRLRPGTYRISQTFRLQGEADSGFPDRPVVWCADGDCLPVVDGGFEVKGFRAVTDREALERIPAAARRHVRSCDVRAAGFTHLSPPGRYGFYCGVQELTDFFQDGKRLVPARHPNEGWLLVEDVGRPSAGWIKASLPDFKPWANEPDLMATGFWNWFWADYTTPVARVDAKERALEIDLSRGNGKPIPVKPSQTFFLLNALCAIDSPGEWYLDSRSGVLYVWPFDGTRDSRFVLSSFTPPFLSASGIHDVRFEGLVFQNGRKNGIELSGCRDVVFAGNVVRRFGGNGMTALNGVRMTISDNVFTSFGHGALMVSGGDRRTLEHSGNVISNNDFSDVENRRRTYSPHLHLAGVGAEVSFNRFRNAPSSAIRLEGNDFLITSNLVEDVVLESDDQGALDIYFNASYFGNIYSYNTWKNIGRPSDKLQCGQAAVRFDGNISGQTVVGNRFLNCGVGHFGAIQSCGGRLHLIDNNLFVNCSRAMSISHYSTNYWFNKIRPTLIKPCLEDVCITNGPYAARYPGIKDLLWTNQVSHLVCNITVGDTSLLVNPPEPTVAYGNFHFPKMPDVKFLRSRTPWRPIPEENETGPRPTPLLLRASRVAD